MDPILDPNTVFTFTLWLLVLLLNADQFTLRPAAIVAAEDDEQDMAAVMQMEDRSGRDTLSLMQTTLQNFRLCTSLNVYHDELLYWVKPRSTTWFSRFVVEQYDRSRWVSMFRMSKEAVFTLAEVIRPHVEKKNTRYRFAIPVVVRIACTLFKLCHGANLTVCSEMFAIGKSSVSKILREVVHSINDCLKSEIAWPQGEDLLNSQRRFQDLCALPAVVGALDGVHIAIAKPSHSPAAYYYFKTGGYSMSCQVVVDSDKRFLDLCVGMPGSTHDSRVLRRSTLFHLGTHNNLFNPSTPMEGFSPYLIADSGYPLLPWLMTPHREHAQLSEEDALLNKKLKKGRVVVENAFGILKQSFREFLGKSDLHITFLPDVVLCCGILHNILLHGSHVDVEELLALLAEEGLTREADTPPRVRVGPLRPENTGPVRGVAALKRRELGVYLSQRRRRRLDRI